MSGFLDSLNQFGGTMVTMVGDVTRTVVNAKIAEKTQPRPTKNVARPTQTIQPALAQPEPDKPIKGVNSNGETIAVNTNAKPSQMTSLLDNKWVVYGGAGLLVSLGAAVIYKLVK